MRPKTRRVQASSGWSFPSIAELWSHRELLVLLASREFRPRYRQTVLGVAWVVMQPLVAGVVFAFVFGRIAGLPSDGTPYIVFAYTGFVGWNFFAGGVTRASNSLVGNQPLVTKVYLPRLALPTSSILLGYIDVGVSWLLLVIMFIHFRLAPTWTILVLPLPIVLLTIVTVGIGLWAAALNARYRDFTYALPVLLQILLFVSPVAYSGTLVPEELRWVAALNPVYACIEGLRHALFGRSSLTIVTLALSSASAVATLVTGLLVFRRIERTFADRM